MFDAMVSGGRGGPVAFAALTATNPARLFGLQGKGEIAVGMDADLVLWNKTRQVTYGADDLHDNVGYNPWEGRSITGWPETVLLRGQTLVENGQFLGTPGQGQWIARPEPGVWPNARGQVA
jgi:dihydropyrimidinase